MRIERGADETTQRSDLLLQRAVERRADFERHFRQQLRELLIGRGRRGRLGIHDGGDRRQFHDDGGLVGRHEIWSLARVREGSLFARPAIGYQAQLVEHLGDVGLLDLLGQHAFGAERARLAEVEVPFLRGVHEDGNGRGARIVLDRLHGLEAIHARHHVVHENDVGAHAREVVDGGFRGFGRVHRDFVTFKDSRQKRACGLRIVHDQSSLGRHQLPPRRTQSPDLWKV